MFAESNFEFLMVHARYLVNEFRELILNKIRYSNTTILIKNNVCNIATNFEPIESSWACNIYKNRSVAALHLSL